MASNRKIALPHLSAERWRVAAETGRDLLKVRDSLSDARWLEWLHKELGMTPEMAEVFVDVARVVAAAGYPDGRPL